MTVYLDEQIPEITITYKQMIPLASEVKINTWLCVVDLIKQTWDQNTIEVQEEFKVIYLNNRNIVKGIYTLSRGGLTGTIVDIRLIFAIALKSLSCQLIITHNHPSSACKPSQADIEITKKIKSAGELLDIKVVDHIIVTPHGTHFSFMNEGIL